VTKPRVHVWYVGKGCWRVGVEGDSEYFTDPFRLTVAVAHYETRDAANVYAKGLRRTLREKKL
jgi:hypothetical protein